MSDRAAQLSPGGVLHDEADRAVAECRRHTLGIRVPRHHDDGRRRGGLADALYDVETVQPRQRHLRQENVRTEAANDADCLEAIRHRSDDLEVLLSLEETPEAPTDDVFGVGQYDPDRPRTPCLCHSLRSQRGAPLQAVRVIFREARQPFASRPASAYGARLVVSIRSDYAVGD